MAHRIPSNSPQVDAAISRVLAAEQAAQAAIGAARAEASATLETARNTARRIGDRAEACVAACRASTERAVAARATEIDATIAALREIHSHQPAELLSLEQAIEALARELTGGRE